MRSEQEVAVVRYTRLSIGHGVGVWSVVLSNGKVSLCGMQSLLGVRMTLWSA
jgi:hypothetical protein